LLTALKAMGQPVQRYTIVDLSDTLKERQRDALQEFADTVRWVSEIPATMTGVVIGNEVLDAMPVTLLARVQGQWNERGVALEDGHWVWQDRPTALRPPAEIDGPHDYLTEVHPQSHAFVRTIGDSLRKGAAFFLDYGFPEAEYYHPQRHMGTVMCHRAHRADSNPLEAVGLKDITAHVNFTGVALAAQEAGLEVLGYTSQAHFLMNCGLIELMQNASLQQRAAAQKLVMEHEMGELFKVIGLFKGPAFEAMGFTHGDRTHRL
jgi:SAM-dependent MidA family methyltransferase